MIPTVVLYYNIDDNISTQNYINYRFDNLTFSSKALPCLIAEKNKTSIAIDLNRSSRLSKEELFLQQNSYVVCRERSPVRPGIQPPEVCNVKTS